MNVEIINVGTELLLGEIINTNATYLQKMCKELGFNVFFQTVVGDNSQRFLDCLEIAFNRGCDCVITTGGLGPTEDDLTKELSAKYLGLEMIFNEAEAKKVNDKCCFVSQLDQVTDNNFKQAYFPKDCYVLDNPIGTANGCVMSKDKKMIVNLCETNKDKTMSDIAREYGLTRTSITQWRKKYGTITTSTGETTSNDEILKLKKELQQVQLENEILKKAVAIFSKEQKIK